MWRASVASLRKLKPNPVRPSGATTRATSTSSPVAMRMECTWTKCRGLLKLRARAVDSRRIPRKCCGDARPQEHSTRVYAGRVQRLSGSDAREIYTGLRARRAAVRRGLDPRPGYRAPHESNALCPAAGGESLPKQQPG